jgi:tRNA modification GTPase
MNNTMTFHQVCAACATPPGQSGIAVIRLSGPGSALAVDTIFQPSGRQASTVRRLMDIPARWDVSSTRPTVAVDQVIVTRYTAPSSYTGEEVVEISCHGGIAVRQMILDLLFNQGVRPLSPVSLPNAPS